MLYAINKNNERITPQPNIDAYCPGCKLLLVAKCGSINIHHFAHINSDCDSWYEPESEWHKKWKEKFSIECREVVIGNHRADIKTKKGMVIELQNSSISAEEIIERENFYNKMMWVINGESFKDNFEISHKEGYVTFRWKHPRKCWMYAKKPIYIDFGNQIFRMKKMHNHLPCRGWGLVSLNLL